MLRSMTDLNGYAIGASDGTIGHVRDCYFDDESWIVPYLVVDTGAWLTSRKVLIPPRSVGQLDWEQKLLPVSITREQVRNSPFIDAERPVSRQHERLLLAYYGYACYWSSAGMREPDAYSGPLAQGAHVGTHLRSCRAVAGYRIMATDGEIGHMESLLIEEQSWTIGYMVVKTGPWRGGYQVLIAPRWIRDVSWPDSTVTVDLTRQTVREAPSYDPATYPDRRATDIRRHRKPAHFPARVT